MEKWGGKGEKLSDQKFENKKLMRFINFIKN